MYNGKIFYNGKLYVCRKTEDNKSINSAKLDADYKITEIIEMTNEDFQIIKKEISKDTSNIFKNKKLNEIAKINPLIAHVDIFVNYLDKILDEIPYECRGTFYKNLETLDIKIVKNLKINSKNFSAAADYEIKTNTIRISKEALDNFKLHQKNKCPNSTINDFLARLIIHELFHTASTIYDKETKQTKAGVIAKRNDLLINSALNEGITEVLTNKVLDSDNTKLDNIFKYKEFTRLVNQLIILVGYDNVISSYFLNNGTESIKDGLYFINNDYEAVDKSITLFGLVDSNNYDNPIDMDYIVRFQYCLLLFFEMKLEILKKYNNFDEIKDIMDCMIENILFITSKNRKVNKSIETIQLQALTKYNEIKNKYYYLKEPYQRKR
ncbi:MAG: hypothetical protein IKX00_03460 [Bacilli bacterium]|nr:hypothetical protein [Bacilli bacterium]